MLARGGTCHQFTTQRFAAPPEPAKKNAEPPATVSLAAGLASAVASAIATTATALSLQLRRSASDATYDTHEPRCRIRRGARRRAGSPPNRCWPSSSGQWPKAEHREPKRRSPANRAASSWPKSPSSRSSAAPWNCSTCSPANSATHRRKAKQIDFCNSPQRARSSQRSDRDGSNSTVICKLPSAICNSILPSCSLCPS